MKKRKALIFGITGQDGSYLAEFLLKKNYLVFGVIRRSSSFNTGRIDKIYQEPFTKNKKLFLIYGDITDSSNVFKIINEIKPNEIYNLAAQSHVKISFEMPEYTSQVDALGALRILESIKQSKLINKTKYYQAGTSELYGKNTVTPQNEKTLFYPASPYGVSKLYAHWMSIVYRESYGIYACNGILFNHESPRRGHTFVTKKIIDGLVKIKAGRNNSLILGNLYAKRDWGHAKDYVKAMWLMLQKKEPQDFVIATGNQYTVKQFINLAAKELKMKISWRGKGIKEVGIWEGKKIITLNKKYFRPNEVESLKGDFKKAKKILKWKPSINIKSLIKDMIDASH